MVAEDLRPSAILTAEAIRNAVRAVAAVGGSTNAAVHLLAIARRVDAPVTLDDIDTAGRGIPLLADIQPAGAFLMEDFYGAGGLDAVLGQIVDSLEPSRTVSGGLLADQYRACRRATCRSSGRPTRRSRRRPGSPCCAATSPPTAR